MVRRYCYLSTRFHAKLARVNEPELSGTRVRKRHARLWATLAATACVALGASGCSRYDIQGDGQGRIVRIDRLTGAVDYLQGTRFVRIENAGDHRREAEELARVHDWGALTYDNKYTLRLKTAFRNDRLYYQIGIVPVPPANVFNFRIALNDGDGFQVASLSLNTPDGVPTADSGIAYSGFTQSEAEVYRSVRSWTPRVEMYSGRIAPSELP
jgi:hypothetical protein